MKFELFAVVVLCSVYAVIAEQDDSSAGVSHHHQHIGANLPLPLRKIHSHVCGLHVGSGNITHQMIAHHYCGTLPTGVTQCILYDSMEKDAKLLGVEYVITADKLATLPKEEQSLWHSHVYEVKSGLLNLLPLQTPKRRHLSKEKECSGLGCIFGRKKIHRTEAVEHEPQVRIATEMTDLQNLVGTYGKTFHTWNSDSLNGDIPFGVPELMVSITADGQANPKLVDAMDRITHSTAQKRVKQRETITVPKPPTEIVEADAGHREVVPAIVLTQKRNVQAATGEKEALLQPIDRSMIP